MYNVQLIVYNVSSVVRGRVVERGSSLLHTTHYRQYDQYISHYVHCKSLNYGRNDHWEVAWILFVELFETLFFFKFFFETVSLASKSKLKY